MFIVTDAWRSAYPGAAAGILVMRGVTNPPHDTALESRKEELVSHLRDRCGGMDRAAISALPVLQAYDAYFKRYKKTYHVQLQLESLVFKGKTIPSVACLVEAMFMAELKNLLLTAGHDLDALELPIHLDVARGDEQYRMLNGQEQSPKAGDMLMADGKGIISTVLYGPDQRTPIKSQTKNVFFTTYAPSGISKSAVKEHLLDIESNVRLFAPQAQTEQLEVFTA